MTHKMFTRRASSIFVLGLIAFWASACGDATAPNSVGAPFPPAALPSIATMRGTVDVAAGTLTFEPVGTGGAPSLTTTSQMHAQVYGNQGVTVRLYSSAVTVVNPSSPGKKTYSGAVGLRNLLPYAIGDEQGAVSPVDTMGIFVIFTSSPTVFSPTPCVGCTVTLLNPDGVGAFDAPNEQYFFWKDRLRAAGSGSDTTRSRRTWTFEASTGVTNFSFDVLVSAAWPQPYESVWSVAFEGDSLPDTQAEPRWSRVLGGAGTLATASSGLLKITTASAGTYIVFLRQDSIAPATSAFAEGSFRLNSSASSNIPYTGMIIDDDARSIGVGLSGTTAGFVTASLTGFLAGGTVPLSTSSLRTYQLRKFGADSVQLWIDGARALSRPYAQFDASTQTTLTSFVAFGSFAQSAANSASYDYVHYVLGRPTP